MRQDVRVFADLDGQGEFQLAMLDTVSFQPALQGLFYNSQLKLLVDTCVPGEANFWRRDEVDAVVECTANECGGTGYRNAQPFDSQD